MLKSVIPRNATTKPTFTFTILTASAFPPDTVQTIHARGISPSKPTITKIILITPKPPAKIQKKTTCCAVHVWQHHTHSQS
jgi:hypothetical protein